MDFYSVATVCNFNTTPRTGFALDGSGYYLDATTPSGPKVTAANGKVITGTNWTDSNGNFFSATVVSGSETDWKDSAGHTSLKIITSSTSIQYQYPDTSGVYQTATLKLTSTPIKTHFVCSGITDYTGTANLPTELDLANGQKYLFSYEPTPANTGYYTGRIKRVTLPTGGYIEHQYGTTNDGINCSDGTTTNLTVIVSDGTTSSTWQLTRAPSGSNWNTTVTAPQLPYDSVANQSVFTFNASSQELTEKFYQGSTTGTLLRTVNNTWNGSFPATQITILDDNSTQNEVETSYDSYGNLLLMKEHDWGTGTPGTVIRTTTYNYLNGSAYLAANIVNRPTRVTVADAAGTIKARTDIAYDESTYINSPCLTGVTQHNDTTFTCTYTVRGNATTVTSYTDPVTPAGAIAKHSYYDSLGNLVKADLNCCQQKSWTFSSTTNYSFPDSVTSGSSSPQLTVSATYNAYTGLLATATDENGQKTIYAYADPGHLNRVTSITRPDNAQITYSYDDINHTVQVTSPVQNTNVVSQKTFADPLGRTIKQQVLDGSSVSYTIVETQYDSWGRAYRVSNPHNSTAQYWTETRTDALGRTVKTILADGGQAIQAYSTNATTATDPAGVQRKSLADGAGRMASVYEPDVANGNSLTQLTSYTYDVLDNLKQVTQGAQTRTFVYDALGRLTDSTTPEAGHFNFQYNTYNLLTQRTDARGVITTYTYDNLNRPYQTIYNVGSTGVPATATVTLNYGTNSTLFNNGRVTSMTDGSGSESYSYDQFGRITQLQKVIGANTFTTGYQYNLAGELSQLTYPSGRVAVQSYDAIGRLCSVGASGSTCTTGMNYVSGYTYSPAGQPTAVNYGNGVALTIGYNQDNLLLQSLLYKKGTQTLFGLTYWYKTDATNCSSAPSTTNGQIRCITDSVDNGRSVVYGYDALYRMTSAVTTGSTAYPKWGLSETYDRYGNRSAQSVTAGTGPHSSVTIDPNTNRISGSPYAYDLNGNMVNDSTNTLVYDGENNNVSATNTSSSGTYTFDGRGLRVKKVVASTTTVEIYSGSLVIAEYVNGAAPASPTNEYVYSGSQRVYGVQSGTAYYFHNDHLSLRVRTNTSGAVADQRGHYPFGETWYSPSGAALIFASYYRDTESGNDYALARSYISGLARFSSPDRLAGSLSDPQTLSRFVYAQNDPCDLTDPMGLSPTPCKFNITIKNATRLSPDQLGAAETEINRILGNGDTGLSAQFNVGKADFTATLSDYQNTWWFATLHPGVGPQDYGKNSQLIEGFGSLANRADIFVNTIQKFLPTTDLGLATGRAIAHEFGHFGLQIYDNNLEPGPLNVGIMQKGDLALTNPQQGLFSPLSVPTLRKLCEQRHGSAGSSGGGGGFSSGLDGFISWEFVSPVLYGQEGTIMFGAGFWAPNFTRPVGGVLRPY